MGSRGRCWGLGSLLIAVPSGPFLTPDEIVCMFVPGNGVELGRVGGMQCWQIFQ